MSKFEKSNDLLKRWRSRNKNTGVERKEKGINISSKPTESPALLSSGQQRLWFLQELFSDNPFYHYADVYTLKGKLNEAILIKSFEFVVQRHSILRTTFHFEGESCTQRIHEKAVFDYGFIDLSQDSEGSKEQKSDALLREKAQVFFDLTEGPLLRVTLVKMTELKHKLAITMHHIVTDKWSMKILREELAFAYNEFSDGRKPSLNPLPFQYEDYAYWQQGKTIDPLQIAYWRDKLKDCSPNIKLFHQNQPRKETTYKGAFLSQKFTPDLSEKLKNLSAKTNTTLFVLLLTIYKLLLHRYSGQEDILVGTPFTNRNQSVLEKLIGFFNDTLVLRSDFSGELTFTELLKEIRQTVLDAFTNKDVPFETIVDTIKPERYLSSNPLFQVMFLFHKVPENPKMGQGIEIEYEPFDIGICKFDLTLYIAEAKDHISATIEYSLDLFDEPTIQRMQGHFLHLLEQVIENPNQKISELQLITAAERSQQLKNWNSTRIEKSEVVAIHHFFEKYAKATPEATALKFLDQSYSYKELDEKASYIAKGLVAAGVGSNIPVGICAERSMEMIVGVLAILKAGGVYLPIDPEYPSERITFMLEQAEVPFVLTQVDQTENFLDNNTEILTFQELYDAVYDDSTLVITEENKPSDLAYIIYTSGSVGKPKAVAVSHENIVHSTSARFSYYDDQPKSFLLLSSFAFDSSMVGIFWTLCSGGTLVIAEKKVEQNMQDLSSLFSKYQTTHTLLLPSLYALLLEQGVKKELASLNTVIVAGEECTSRLCSHHFERLPAVKLYNEYGPTEASVWCTAHRITKEDVESPVPIGRPIPNMEIFILDKNMSLVPIGVVGELYVGGVGVTKGYLNRPDLTEERFLNHPFNNGSKNKVYKTGDLAVYRPDGLIDFLGRVDHQVKIRGHRIELAEIQKTMLLHPAIDDVVVMLLKQKQDQGYTTKRIGAYYTINKDLESKELKGFIKSRLPAYMLPAAFFQLPKFPKLPNGKLDVKALNQFQENEITSADSFVEARTDLERDLTNIWEEVLNVKPIGIYDNFFEIGGDSILSIQINGRARKKGIHISPNLLFENQTIASLSSAITLNEENLLQEKKEKEYLSAVPVLTPIQHWYFETHRNAPAHWNLGLRFQPSTSISTDLLKIAIQKLIERHDALRMAFNVDENGIWKPMLLDVQGENVFSIIEISVKGEKDANNIITSHIQKQSESFALSEGNLFQCVYFKCENELKDQILLLAHHLVLDNVSWSIITQDLETLLDQLSKKEKPKLTPSTIPYSLWSNKLVSIANSGKLTVDYNYWKKTAACSTDEFPTDFEKSMPVLEKSINYSTFRLEADYTELLLQKVPKHKSIRINELLLCGMMMALKDWNNIKRLRVEMEGHGRESLFDDSTFFSSVGWFTAIFPVLLELNESLEVEDNLKQIKEQVRNVPNKGITYGMLRYLSESEEVRMDLSCTTSVLFNYLGVENESGKRILGKGKTVVEEARSPSGERYHCLELNIKVQDMILEVSCAYSKSLYHQNTIDSFMDEYQKNLIKLIDHCISSEKQSYTPSDFPEADISQGDLDALLGQL